MSPVDRAIAYLAKCPGAVAGQNGHGTAFATVCAVVNGFALDEAQAEEALRGWNATCQPPWSERELRHKIADAARVPHAKPRGFLMQNAPRRFDRHPDPVRPASKPAAPRPVAPRYVLDPESKLPEPLKDGTRALIRAAFEPDEGVRIVAAKINEAGEERPESEGPTLSREEWLRKLDKADGDPNRIFKSASRAGIYVGLNPLKLGGNKDADVTAFRHVLLEFDNISPAEQWNLYQQSRIPCTAIIHSGGKSVHAWVRVDARDRREYDERVAALYAHFEAHGLDAKNKNPSRLSRLPNCVRFSKRQELLAINSGCASFSEWLGERQAEGAGETVTVEQLANFDTANDPNTVLGRRWLCRSQACLFVGPSGVGKSSLAVQMAVTWGLGQPFFGIQPVRPLKSLFIQAENDMGDLAEMFQGVLSGFGLSSFSDDFELVKRNLVFVRDSTHTGFEFTQAVRRLIDRHKPDLVWIDPVLSFIGDDISKQTVCGQFFRNWLNPIADATGVCWMMVHHTNKPPADSKARKGWNSSDYAYMGTGSGDLTNWARAVCVLGQRADGEFELLFAKRGARANAIDEDGARTIRIYLKHAEAGIRWERATAPPPAEEHKSGRPSKSEELLALGLGKFLDETPSEGEGLRECARRLEDFAGSKLRFEVSRTTCQKTVAILLKNGALEKRDGLFFRP